MTYCPLKGYFLKKISNVAVCSCFFCLKYAYEHVNSYKSLLKRSIDLCMSCFYIIFKFKRTFNLHKNTFTKKPIKFRKYFLFFGNFWQFALKIAYTSSFAVKRNCFLQNLRIHHQSLLRIRLLQNLEVDD